MQMRKNCTFSSILQKVKSNFFANIYHSLFPIKFETLKPPIGQLLPEGFRAFQIRSFMLEKKSPKMAFLQGKF